MITVYVVLTGTFPIDIISPSSLYLHSLVSLSSPTLHFFRLFCEYLLPSSLQHRKERKTPPCPVAFKRTFDLSNRTESGHVVSQERTTILAEAINALLYHLEFFDSVDERFYICHRKGRGPLLVLAEKQRVLGTLLYPIWSRI